jgi:DNA-binding NarL/FixJ family response regulator
VEADSPLNAIEEYVLEALSRGGRVVDLASELSYSRSHLERVIRGIREKLHAKTRTHAVGIALREGYIK